MEDSLSKTSLQPDMTELIEEFHKSCGLGDHWGRVRQVEETRLAIWEGQHDDGKKHDSQLPEGEPAFPWDGASDSRVYQADEIINHLVSASVAAFWRGELKVVPVNPDDIGKAGERTVFLNWLVRNRMREQLDCEVELSGQYANWYGWCGLHVHWVREIGYCMRHVTIEEVVQNARAVAGAAVVADETTYEGRLAVAVAMLPGLVADKDREEEAVGAMRTIADHYARAHAPVDLDSDDIKPIGKGAARRMVRDLRGGSAIDIPVPHLMRNQPVIEALKPWHELIVPVSSVSVESARVLFIRRYYTEAQLRAMAMVGGWEQEWVDEAAKTAGRVSAWSQGLTGTGQVWQWKAEDGYSNLIEIIWAFTRSVDEDGLTGIWQTVFSAHVASEKQGWALHEQLNHTPGVYPIIGLSRERIDKSVLQSRGVPEITLTSQREEKSHRDGLIDLLSMAVLPPILRPRDAMGQKYKWGPAQENEVSGGREPKFMNVPTGGAPLAVEYLSLLDRKNARYFGMFHPEVPVAHTQLMLEGQVRRFLQAWSCALKQAYSLCVKYAPEMIERVVGRRPDISEQYDMGDFDLMFHFDTIQLDPDLLERKLDAFGKLIPEDSTGTINRSSLVQIKARMIDPEIARQIVQDQTQANERLVREVQQDVMSMFLGNPVAMRDASDDPTAMGRFNILAQTVQANPRYMTALDPKVLVELFGPQVAANIPPGRVDPVFSHYMANYIQNLKMGVTQQQNKVVGRTGVTQ